MSDYLTHKIFTLANDLKTHGHYVMVLTIALISSCQCKTPKF